MSKKERVRQHIESMQDGARFNVASVAGYLKVTSKDVSNVIAELKRDGIVTGEVVSPHKYMTYTLIKNVQQAVKLKTADKPADQRDPPAKRIITKQDSADAMKPLSFAHYDAKPPRKAPAKRRSPFVMAIDAEIKRMEQRIATLRKTRREFE